MTTSLARKLRATPTPAEVRLWRLLYSLRTGGFHFRKQHQLGNYVVDFVCIRAGMIIEVDGETHGDAAAIERDAVRDDYLRGRGFNVLRFTNHDVMSNGDGVMTVISAALTNRLTGSPGTTPSPALPARGRVSGGGRGDDEASP